MSNVSLINNSRVLWTAFTIALLDLIGFGMILPVLEPLFYDDIKSIFDTSTEMGTRNILYGFILGFYSLAQFIGAPLSGALSDRVGRKKILLLLFVVNGIGAIGVAFAIYAKSIILLFIARIFPAFFGSSIMITQTILADISDEKSKAKNFGLLGVAFGLGFIIGPIIGGIIGSISYALPFLVAGCLTFINGVLMWTRLRETVTVFSKKKLDIFSGFRNLKFALTDDRFKGIYMVVFFLSMGFALFTQYFQVYLDKVFNFDQRGISYMFAWIGIWVAISQGAILRPVANRFTPHQILKFSIPLFALTYIILMLPQTTFTLALALILLAVFQGLTFPNTLAIISNLSSVDEQGESIGINQSVQSFAYGIPPVLAGSAIGINLYFPNVFGFIVTCIAFVIFIKYVKPE